MQKVVMTCKQATLICVLNYVEPPDLRRYQSMAQELEMTDNVIFTEPQPLEMVPYFLAAADVTVVARPDCPGIPIKMLNYMAAKRAIVCPMGSTKWLEHMHDVIAVPDHDCEALAQGILTLLADPALRTRLGENAYRTLEERYALTSIVEQIDATYAAALLARQS